jgi:hypothetical protein
MHGGGRGYQELYLYSACRDFYERFGWRYIGEGLDYPATAVWRSSARRRRSPTCSARRWCAVIRWWPRRKAISRSEFGRLGRHCDDRVTDSGQPRADIARNQDIVEADLALAEQRPAPEITHLFSPTLVRRHSVVAPQEGDKLRPIRPPGSPL